MSLSINLTQSEEARLSDEAIQLGVAPEELATRLVREHLTLDSVPPEDMIWAKLRAWQMETETQTYPDTSTHELFARWAAEDALKSDEEIAKDELLWQEFQRGIDEERRSAGMRTIFDV